MGACLKKAVACLKKAVVHNIYNAMNLVVDNLLFSCYYINKLNGSKMYSHGRYCILQLCGTLVMYIYFDDRENGFKMLEK